MSTLITTILGNGTKSVPVDTLVEGSAKAWMNLNGTGTIALRDSFNTSSVTDNGVGDYTQNFTAALPNANYATSSQICGSTVSAVAHVCVMAGTTAGGANLKTTTQLRIQSGLASTGALTDIAEMAVGVLAQ